MDETRYRARFYLDPNRLALAKDDRFELWRENWVR